MSAEVEPRYFVEAVAKALDVLEAFDNPLEELSIADVVRRANMTYCSTFRLLYTLEKRGYVERTPRSRRYKLVQSARRFRIGYAALDHRSAFSREVSRSLALAARADKIGLVVKDNESNPAKAQANVRALLDERVHMIIVHQPHECIAGPIASRCREARVPLLAVEFPHPGAHYLGVDHYRAGRIAGEHLRRFRRARMRSQPMVLLSDPPNEARRAYLRGVTEGLRPDSAEGVEPTVLTVNGGPDEYYRRVKQVLREESTDAKELPMIVAPCDELASACVRALASLGQRGVPVVGMGGAPGSMAYLLRGGPGTASLACFPETYGERAVGLAVRMLNGEEVPANYYAEHALLTPTNLTQYYPDLRCRN